MGRTGLTSLTGLAAALVLSACGSNDESRPSLPTTTAPPALLPTTDAPVVAPTTAAPTEPADPSDSLVVLVDFPDPESVAGWSIQNDTVMGGVSNSRTEWADGQMIFAGDLSLDNNGGFCSIRSAVSADFGALAAGSTALALTATGDDQVYLVQVRTDRDLFMKRLEIASGDEQTYVLPFADFTATDFMLDEVIPLEPLDPADIIQIAVYILDKQEGPFRLAIRSFGVV